jgi:NADP-dependent 3-hydroxy acid dehydrogenase YdfG
MDGHLDLKGTRFERSSLPVIDASNAIHQPAPPMKPNDMSAQVVFVTGASAGIGEGIAREAASRGAAVVLFARREDRVNAIAGQIQAAGGRALGVAGDVTSETQLAAAVDAARRAFGGIDLVMANAGFGVKGTLEKLTLSDYQRQFDCNVFGVLRTIYATLPEVKARTGMIGVVGSANGYLSVPGWSAYCMSKAALRSLCACVRHELLLEGVSVTHLAPGMIESEFRRVDNHGQANPDAQDPVPTWLAMPTKKAAGQMLDAVLARKEEAVITWHAKALISLERHAHWLVSESLRHSGPLIQRLSKD